MECVVKMGKNVITLVILLIASDDIAIDLLRGILLDFLIGVRNRKIAKEIYRQQSIRDKILLSFIKQYLKEYISAFEFYHIVYMAELISLVPQYVVIIVFDSVKVIIALVIIKSILFILLRFQLDSFLKSKYCKGK